MNTTIIPPTNTIQLYTPAKLVNSTEQEGSKQRRLLLMGPPKSGKTFAALTFPNPIFIDFDHGLTEVKPVPPYLPMWDDKWCAVNYPGKNKTDIVCEWLRTEAPKLSGEQTIVIDSLSTLCDILTVELEKKTPIGKNGEKDGFWFWKAWSEWLRDFHVLINKFQCNIVMNCHEQEVRDSETGRVLSYKWLLKGQDFSARLSQYYTDVFRQTRTATETGAALDKTVTPRYDWQVQPDSVFQLCCTRIRTQKKFLPANFNSFNQ